MKKNYTTKNQLTKNQTKDRTITNSFWLQESCLHRKKAADLKKSFGLQGQNSYAGASKRGDRGGKTGGGNLGKN